MKLKVLIITALFGATSLFGGDHPQINLREMSTNPGMYFLNEYVSHNLGADGSLRPVSDQWSIEEANKDLLKDLLGERFVPASRAGLRKLMIDRLKRREGTCSETHADSNITVAKILVTRNGNGQQEIFYVSKPHIRADSVTTYNIDGTSNCFAGLDKYIGEFLFTPKTEDGLSARTVSGNLQITRFVVSQRGYVYQYDQNHYVPYGTTSDTDLLK